MYSLKSIVFKLVKAHIGNACLQHIVAPVFVTIALQALSHIVIVKDASVQLSHKPLFLSMSTQSPSCT